jgi:hypothetical protein
MSNINKSTCCNETVRVNRGGEGTNYYICNKCDQPCDVNQPPDELVEAVAMWLEEWLDRKHDNETRAESARRLLTMQESLTLKDGSRVRRVTNETNFDGDVVGLKVLPLIGGK